MLATRTFIKPALARAFSASAPRPSVAKITLVGHLGADPELVTTNGGKEYVKYTVGHKHKVAGEDKMSWFKVTCFSENKGYFQFIRKGTQVYVEGGVTTTSYEEGGKNHIHLNITQRELRILSQPREKPTEATEEEQA